MPYKDPEQKRQWERDHREERNARRRTSAPVRATGQTDVEHPIPSRIADQRKKTAGNIVALLMGIAFLFTMLLVAWRSRGLADPSGQPQTVEG